MYNTSGLSSLLIKAHYGSAVKRINIENKNILSVENLTEILFKRFPGLSPSFVLRYKDEGQFH